MATTTNYGWTTPDDTALVKDGAAAIRTLGSSVDTTTKNLNPSTTLGDIEYRSSTANTNTRLGIGSAGQVLTVAAGVPSWATPVAGGKVLQVVSSVITTDTSISTTSLTDTGITATITPTSATSKILVMITALAQQSVTSANGENGAGAELLRAGTSILSYGNEGFRIFGYPSSEPYVRITTPVIFLDSPATTSATIYKLQAKVSSTAAGQTIRFQISSTPSTITLMEIGA